jgi:hypothetical protein
MNNFQPNQTAARQDVVSAVLIDPETRAFATLPDEQLAVAVPAALAVISAAGITPEQAADANFERESWDLDGFPEPGPTKTLKIADVWGEANAAAQQALKRRWPNLRNQWRWIQLTLDDGKRAA